MRVYCRCGNMLTNQLDPNDTEYYVYSDREWCEIQKNEYTFWTFPILAIMFGIAKNVAE
mgnify:CR=1 FL=1